MREHNCSVLSHVFYHWLLHGISPFLSDLSQTVLSSLSRALHPMLLPWQSAKISRAERVKQRKREKERTSGEKTKTVVSLTWKVKVKIAVFIHFCEDVNAKMCFISKCWNLHERNLSRTPQFWWLWTKCLSGSQDDRVLCPASCSIAVRRKRPLATNP